MISRFAKSFLVIILALFVLGSFAFFHPSGRTYMNPYTGDLFGEGGVEAHVEQPPSFFNAEVVRGGVIMPKLGNATAKAELGRATWKLLHTVTLRYPENPTPEEREALTSYFHLTSRVYPCGECAEHFQGMLRQFPPQTSSRKSAALWLCALHNKVNERLHKAIFDCAHLDSTYDCGCGDTPIRSVVPDSMDLEQDASVDDVTGVRLIDGR